MSEQTNIQNSEYVKPCSKCGSQDRNSSGKCRPCHKIYAKQHYEKNKFKPKTHACRKCGAQERSIHGNCLPCARAWKKQNREKCKENNRSWRQANPEKHRQMSKDWKLKNKKRHLDSVLQWQKNNPEKARAIKAKGVHNRRARELGNGGTLSKGVVQRLLDIQGGKCACCEADLSKTGYHLDHIMPLALGGLNNDTNVQLLTPSCNLRKGAKHPVDWARQNGRLL
jgi:hypothetical protein